MTRPEPQPAWTAAWIDEILAEHAAGRPRKAMTTLMFRLDDLLGAEDFVEVDDALRALPVERLSASLLVGALTVTSPFRGCVLARGERVDAPRQRPAAGGVAFDEAHEVVDGVEANLVVARQDRRQRRRDAQDLPDTLGISGLGRDRPVST